MDSIVRRLKESRDIKLAKSILESAGYKVNKRSEVAGYKVDNKIKYYAIYCVDPEAGPSEDDFFPIDFVKATSEDDALKKSFEQCYTIPQGASASEISRKDYEAGLKGEYTPPGYIAEGHDYAQFSDTLQQYDSKKVAYVRSAYDDVSEECDEEYSKSWEERDQDFSPENIIKYYMERSISRGIMSEKEFKEIFNILVDYHGNFDMEDARDRAFNESKELKESADPDPKRVESEIKAKVKKIMMSPHYGFDESDWDDYCFVEVSSSDGMIKVEVRAELSYDSMMDMADELNPILAKYDRDAYFDMEDAGIMTAYIPVGPDMNESKELKESASPSSQVYKALKELGIDYEDISEEDGVIYVSREEPYSKSDLDKVWHSEYLQNGESCGLEDKNTTMWFAFDDEIDESKKVEEARASKSKKPPSNPDIFSKIADMSNKEISKDEEVLDYVFGIDDEISAIVAKILDGDGFDDSSFDLTKDSYSGDLYFKGQGYLYTTDDASLRKVDKAIQKYLRKSDFPDRIDTEWDIDDEGTRYYFYCTRYIQ